MNELGSSIKSQHDEIKWFIDLMNFDISGVSFGSHVDAQSNLGIHLLLFFTRQTSKTAKMELEEIFLLEQLSGGEILIEDIIQLRQQVGLIVRSITHNPRYTLIQKGTKWISKEKWRYGSNIIYQHEATSSQIVEILGLEYEKRKAHSKGNIFMRWAPGHNGDRLISVTSIPQNFMDYLFIRFLEAINQIPCNAFRQCPECHSHFVHFSKRIKINCSNKCSARKVSRERRKRMKAETPQKYKKVLEDGSKRARKSYEKKVQHGKPARRPYKYKEEE